MTVCPNCGGNANHFRYQQSIMPRDDMMLRQRAEIERLRAVVRDCARTLQWHLSWCMRKDEKMMLGSLERAWAEVGRAFCEAPPELRQASNPRVDRAGEAGSVSNELLDSVPVSEKK
jgi:hypothetical protein